MKYFLIVELLNKTQQLKLLLPTTQSQTATNSESALNWYNGKGRTVTWTWQKNIAAASVMIQWRPKSHLGTYSKRTRKVTIEAHLNNYKRLEFTLLNNVRSHSPPCQIRIQNPKYYDLPPILPTSSSSQVQSLLAWLKFHFYLELTLIPFVIIIQGRLKPTLGPYSKMTN